MIIDLDFKAFVLLYSIASEPTEHNSKDLSFRDRNDNNLKSMNLINVANSIRKVIQRNKNSHCSSSNYKLQLI